LSPLEHRDTARRDPLADFPLGDEPAGHAEAAPATPRASADGAEADSVAPLPARALAFAADLAGTSLAVTLALISGVSATGRAPRLSGLPWAAAFGLGFSFVFVVVPLCLFGRTVGMSLAGLAAGAGPGGRRLSPSEAARRWAGTTATMLGLGLPLLFTMRDPLRPTPADHLSARGLVREAAS
jgi:hypothetical protein